MIPERIGKYRVLRLLGHGAMGEVYLGEDPYIGRPVAIKMVRDAAPEARERFLHEARIVGGFSHPHIVLLLEIDFAEGEPYIVMEYLPGESLEGWLTRARPLSARLLVVEDLCSALAYAHAQGVLHRDVKPSNVQVLPDGRAKLMDFGIARADAKLTATGTILGTPIYMAPEILRTATYSPRSDLYSAALVAYEALGAANPFRSPTVAGCLHNVLSVAPPPLRQVQPAVPEAVAAAVMACLEKNRALVLRTSPPCSPPCRRRGRSRQATPPSPPTRSSR